MLAKLYRPDDCHGPSYSARIAEFTFEGMHAQMRPASQDQTNTALILVDIQESFCNPKGTLYVPGAQNDVQRTVEWMYKHTESITSVYASLDSHIPFQIFFSAWWQYEDGSHPPDFTMIMTNTSGELVDQDGRRVMPLFDPIWSMKYVRELQANAQKNLMLWPPHTMVGTQGHMLVAPLSEAIAYHAAARLAQPIFLTKGTVPQVEHYGIFRPEVMYAKNPNGGLNTVMLDALANHDLIYVAGQAKSHCVLATMLQLVEYFGQKDPLVVRKLRFLTDCTSSVQHPAVDFDALANAELARMAKLGVQLVTTADPIG